MHQLAILFFLTACATSLADAPTSQPTTRSVNTFRPMEFLRSYDQLAGEDPAAYLALYSIDDNDDTQRLADVESKFDSQIGMLQKIVQDKWGDSARERCAARPWSANIFRYPGRCYQRGRTVAPTSSFPMAPPAQS